MNRGVLSMVRRRCHAHFPVVLFGLTSRDRQVPPAIAPDVPGDRKNLTGVVRMVRKLSGDGVAAGVRFVAGVNRFDKVVAA